LTHARIQKERRESPERLQEVKAKVNSNSNSGAKLFSPQRSGKNVELVDMSSLEISHEIWSPIMKGQTINYEFEKPEMTASHIK
jgi:hypothetical protein